MASKAKKLSRGDLVTYRAHSGSAVEAIVRTLHRNGDCTVESRFFLNADGEQIPGYLGYDCRVPASELSLIKGAA